MHRTDVWRGHHGNERPLGPLRGVRDGDTLAYELELPEEFQPWPGRSRVERVFVLLDLGISLSMPCWREMRQPDGSVVPGVDADLEAPATWYVDLVTVDVATDGIVVTDLFVDVMVPVDGRQHRVLDLEELADATADGTVPLVVALDGLRRFQAFLDLHLYGARDPSSGFADFPPRRLDALAALPAPLQLP